MPLLRPRLALLAALALAPALVLTVAAPPAWAQSAPAFDAQGVLELLRPTGLVADGGTSYELFALALGPDGAPIAGLKPKLDYDGCIATEPVDAGGGLYTFTFTPERVDAAGAATVQWKGRLPNKQSYTRDFTIPVTPPPTRAVKLTASPAQMSLGVDKTANVAFDLTGGEPSTFASTKLVVNSSAGTVTNLINLGGPQFGGLYTPPTGNVAQVALVTAVDAADPTRVYGGVAIPLVAKTDQAVTVKPGERVILKVGGREFGPVTADSKGRAKVGIVIPPGFTSATRVVVGADGVPREDSLDLKMPETRRLAIFPMPKSVPADARIRVPVRTMVVTSDGRPDEAAQVVFSASAGSVGPARHEGAGIYIAEYTPPAANAASTVTLTAKLEGATAVQTTTQPLALVPTRAATVTLSAPPIPAGATSFTVTAQAKGPDGAPLAGRKLVFSANGAKLAEVKDLKNGDYQALFTPTGKGAVEVTATVAAPATGNPLARVLLVPGQDRLPADGLSSTMLTVATVDEYGSPVGGVEVALALTAGDGSLPTVTTTNADGFAQVYYTAGRKHGFVGVEAKAMGQTAGASLVQAPEEVKVPALPVVGNAATVGLVKEWAGATAFLRVERQ